MAEEYEESPFTHCPADPSQPTQMFEWKTTAIKFLSCVCCVGAGMPVGPEGPMIFLGATLGGLVSQGTINFSLIPPGAVRDGAEKALSVVGGALWPFKRFRNKVDQRDFMTAGCAAGVAGAFGAPIGGLLFAMEEVASFWNITLGWQIFFACMTSVFSRSFAEAMAEPMEPGGSWGLFTNTIAYEVTRDVKPHVLSMGVAIFVGAACGVTASLFTRTNLKWSSWRAKYVGSVKWKRFAEPMLYMFVFSTIAMTLPIAFACRSSGCFYGSDGSLECSEMGSSSILKTEASVEVFMCRPDVQEAFKGQLYQQDAAGPTVVKYNELATLMDVSGTEAIVHLMSRDTHLQFGFAAICVFFIYYFGSAIVAGSCIASGLFVPMLLMGACIGRFWGLVAVRVALQVPGFDASHLQEDGWKWIDPGVFAMVGAGAYMAGVSRLTLSLAVIVMEMTNEVHFLLPLLMAIMVAKWIADSLEHALYHSLLETKNIPFLPAAPFGGATLEMLAVEDIMCRGNVVTVRETEGLLAATTILRTSKFNAFPVDHPGAPDGDPLPRHAGARGPGAPRPAHLRPAGGQGAPGRRPPPHAAQNHHRGDGAQRHRGQQQRGRGHQRGEAVPAAGHCGGAGRAAARAAHTDPAHHDGGPARVREPQRRERASLFQRHARLCHVPQPWPAPPARGG
jgi:chloride channel 7